MRNLARRCRRRLALWALTVRDSFVLLLPLTFLGVTATLLANAPFAAVQRVLAALLGDGWRDIMDAVVNATYGVFGLALAVVVGIRLARRLGAGPSDETLPEVSVGMAALVNFMLCLTIGNAPALTGMGRDSMLLGLLVGLATPELLRPLTRIFGVKPDHDCDPTFYAAIRMTPPLVVLGIGVILGVEAAKTLPAPGVRWLAALPPTVHGWIDADWSLCTAAVVASHLLWFVGIHGNMVLEQQAQALFGAGGAAYNPVLGWHPLLGTFGMIGGAGATLGLTLALFIVAREGPFRRLAAVSVLPSLFNINELLIFGLPIALNPLFLWPFVLAPLVMTLIALTAVHAGLLPLLDVQVPWTTPPLLSGYLLTGSWRGPALQVLGLLVSTLIYLPFVRRAEARRVRAQSAAFHATVNAIATEGRPQTQSVPLHGELGLVARGLLAALTRDLGTAALTLAFQPKHDHRGVAVGVEALLRWRHARHGAVRADVAVTLAEEGGVIRALGAWVMEEACARKAQWNALGLSHITMAINVSPLQLDDPLLPALLARCLERYGLTPGEIELEITESQAIPVRQVVDQNLALIVAMGVSLAMDDFGMGYSSLLHMRRFSIHSLKIDGSLTRDVLTNPISRDIIHTIATLGRTRQVEVVAEFVETAEQRDTLAALGCGVFQGYLYSAPLPAAACAEYLLGAGAGAAASRRESGLIS
ncbi:EAL domain-containing protein (putative c-di-GMP-specific phosphodiesterase class I)/cellobiose-specific phosphotransferase system component IIC [Duganella sp. 1411]|uniref:EAL domain-containing protein n=1 Tax=Duganella sp. 1411 TaxID=2806572 RepID=UPI001AE5BDFE|nr:EAL domain-containing protein [Duganella sp. 1411]MBP1203386.1 EAL domain-containing protein (putative c-di-GMP-specific phosphodiesterase class I)/cellobiose-specific phosphotransferase system component IIC [Duganella sp. 1411]